MLELQRNLYVLRRWWWLLLGAAIVGGLVAYVLTKEVSKDRYQATAIIALASTPPSSNSTQPFFSNLSVAADAQLVQTVSTARAAARSLPGVDATQLAGSTQGLATPDGNLIDVSVTWKDPATAAQLANAVAGAFISQERKRLASRDAIIQSGLSREQQRLTRLMRSTSGSSSAQQWLHAQYADTLSKIFQESGDARIQAATEQDSLQLAQPATMASTATIGPKSTVNAFLGAVLAVLIALVFAYAATSSYEQSEAESRQPVLAKVGE